MTIILLSSLLILESNCQILIPLKYFPEYKYDNSEPSGVMKNIIRQRVYAELYIGKPEPKEVQVPLDFTTNEFYIFKNPKYSDNSDQFSDLKFYNPDSTTYGFVKDFEDELIYGYSFTVSYYKQDTFHFNNKESIIPFFEPVNDEDSSGGVGMRLEPPNNYNEDLLRERCFFEQMKKIYKLESYYWTIFYDSNKNDKIEEKAYLLIGCLPHSFNSDIGRYKSGTFQKKDLRKVNYKFPSSNDISFDVDKISGYFGKNENDKITELAPDSNLHIILNFNSAGVEIPDVLLKYYEKAFNDFITLKTCFTGKNKFLEQYFYCKKDNNNIKKIKENFPSIIFQSNDLNYTFILEADDLFYEQDDYVYCLIYFHNSTGSHKDWRMGKPFLRKYPFSINYEDRMILFYSYFSDEKYNGIPVFILIIAIFVTIIIVGLISFFVFKFYLYEKFFRKKRANELMDDDFEYTPKNDEKKNIDKDKDNNNNDDKLGININDE